MSRPKFQVWNDFIYNTKSNDVCLSIYHKLKITVTTEPIELYSSWNIPTVIVLVLRYFLGGGTPPKKFILFRTNLKRQWSTNPHPS